MKRQEQAVRHKGSKIFLAALAAAMTVVLPACDSASPISALVEQNKWEGPLKFVFIERSAVAPYLLSGSDAFLLRFSDDTEFVGIGELEEGDGINVFNRQFHSASSYRINGDIADEPADAIQLLSIPTKIIDVQSIELVKQGKGECTAYVAVLLPPQGGGGWTPVVPEYAEGKKGVYVYDGKAKCTIVPRGGRLMSSISTIGSVNINEEAEWARPKDAGE